MSRQPEPEYMADAAEAAAYAGADFSEVNGAFAERLVELAAEHAVADDARAVDLGTGPGDIPFRVAALRPGWHITAVDASEAMIELAREDPRLGSDGSDGGKPRVRFVVADAKSTGLPGHGFAVVFSNSILHHINDTAALWAEVRRLAAPGGLVFFRDLARPESPEAARRIVDTYAADESQLLREEYYRSLLSSYTPDEIRQELAAAGLGSLGVAMATDRHVDVFGIVG
ncbi:MAG: class I SAM-dependent methyltransferase [Planctomycetota bacterium]